MRPRVVEERMTSQIGPYIVRWWIETDPLEGGRPDSYSLVREIEWKAGRRLDRGAKELAEFLMEGVPSANAVEVTDAPGYGVVIYRNWP